MSNRVVATGLRLLPVAYQWYRLLMRVEGVEGVEEVQEVQEERMMGRRQRGAEAELAAYSWMELQTVVNRSPW